MDIEDVLSIPIPQDEAAAFFLRVTGRDKLAHSPENLEAAWNELLPEEQDQLLKEAEEAGLLEKSANMGMMGGGGAIGGKMGPPPSPAQMPAPSPVSLPQTAQGINSVKTAFLKAAAGLKIAEPDGMPAGGAASSEDEEPSLEEYLRQEAMGGQAEEQAGSAFYRERLQNAMQELEQTKAMADETAQKAQELEQQVAQNDETIQASMQQAQMAQQTAMSNVQQAHQMAMDATNQAMESQSETLRQKQLAAAMRMGVQTLKDNVMGAMANDPTDQLAQQLQAPPPGTAGMVGGQPPPPPQMDPMTGQPMVDPMAAQGQDPNAAAGGPPPEGGPPPDEGGGESGPPPPEKKEKSESKSEKKDDGEKKDSKTHVEVKTGAVLRFLELTKGIRRTA